MDKRVIFATAGSGKTTYIVSKLSKDKRTLIITYTTANYENLRRKIINKFQGEFPENITLMTYFSFLYGFCYKPFLSDKIRDRGIVYENNPNRYVGQNQIQYYMSKNRYLYSNRIALLLEKKGEVDNIKRRIQKYFDEFVIDEIQDIAGRDFSFLEKIMTVNVDMLFVGDFYQHTYDTSRDGNTNQSLFNDKNEYEMRFNNKGILVDNETLNYSWRCSKTVCDCVRTNLGIEIHSNRTNDDDTDVKFITDEVEIKRILEDNSIIKLHYQNGSRYGTAHRNWGETKGEDRYQDVCVLLNKTTAKARRENKLKGLPQSTRNKLYVAITRAKGNVYFIEE